MHRLTDAPFNSGEIRTESHSQCELKHLPYQLEVLPRSLEVAQKQARCRDIKSTESRVVVRRLDKRLSLRMN